MAAENDGTTSSDAKPARSGKHRLITIVKIIIAVVGIWFVGRMVRWNDTAIIESGKEIRNVEFLQDTEVRVLDASLNNGKTVKIEFPDSPVKVRIPMAQGQPIDAELVIDENALIPGTQQPLNIPHVSELPDFFFKLDKGERVHEGFHSLLIKASSRWYLLVAAWALLLIPFLVTAIRWRNLMQPQGINMPLGKCLQLTFVGQFYSIMLPSLTGGDLVKIVYAARLTGSKTKSAITIVLDRVIGLVALMVIASVSAGVQLLLNRRAGIAPDSTLFNVFLMIVGLLALMAVGCIFYFSRRLRRLIGVEWFIETFQRRESATAAVQHEHLERLFRILNFGGLLTALLFAAIISIMRWVVLLPWATHNTVAILIALGCLALAALGCAGGLIFHSRLVDRMMPSFRKAIDLIIRVDETIHVYRGHFGLLVWAFFISLISQLTLPTSAWLSGVAFGMNTPISHFLAYVPVAVLAASLPISPPQGFGIMDFILYHFFVERGTARAGQAFALAQAVRFLPILWNLVGAYWVVTGSYSRHKVQAEEAAMPEDSVSPAH